MVRSLWTGASGMKAQQTAVDTIANNIANVNTVGFKSQDTQFKSLLYQTLQERTTSANGETKPGSAQVGLGTRVSSINTNFTQGEMLANESNTALCIEGNAFFAIRGADNQIYYTRNGDFTWSLDANDRIILTNNRGEAVLDRDARPIMLPEGAESGTVSFGQDGAFAIKGPDGNYVQTGQYVALVQFRNPNGLAKQSNGLLAETAASGLALEEWSSPGLTQSRLCQNYLEGSNVNVADEMVDLIIAQRAYEMNSKIITTSDTMMEQANNLRR